MHRVDSIVKILKLLEKLDSTAGQFQFEFTRVLESLRKNDDDVISTQLENTDSFSFINNKYLYYQVDV